MFNKMIVSSLLIVLPLTIMADNKDVGKKLLGEQTIIVKEKEGNVQKTIKAYKITNVEKKSNNRKSYSYVNFAKELQYTKDETPELLKGFGVKVDNAIEKEDVKSLLTLSITLAMFEKEQDEESKILNSKQLLEIAGDIAKITNSAKNLSFVSDFYTINSFGLNNKTKADKYASLSKDTEKMSGNRTSDEDAAALFLGLIVGGIAYATTSDLTIFNGTRTSMDIYLNGNSVGTLGPRERYTWRKLCDKSYRIKGYNYNNTYSSSTYLSCSSSSYIELD